MTAALSRVLALVGASVLMIACGSGSASPKPTPPSGDLVWPAPADPLQLARDAGLAPETKETLTFHVHAHVDVFLDGKQVIVPAGIGINIQDPDVHRFDFAGTAAYGGIRGCARPCISPLHTHDQSGVIHTESASSTPNRLGAFFVEWNVPFSSTCVGQYCEPSTTIAVYLNGQRHAGDPAAIPLTDREEITVVVGVTPSHIPSGFPPDAPA